MKSKKAAIFIADDNPENLNVLSDILEEAGYDVRAALGGQEMLESVRREKPDLIILDIHMPRLDGYEVCRMLKSSEESRKIPVIFCSALTESYNIVEGFKLGAVDYITKPFRSQEVLARIRTHLELQAKQRELSESLEYLKSAQRHLIQTEKMTSIGIMLAGIAHEINNPVNYIINSLEGFKEDFEDLKKLIHHCAEGGDGGDSAFRSSFESLCRTVQYPELLDEMEALFDGIYTGAGKVHRIVKSLKAFSLSEEEGDTRREIPLKEEVERAVLLLQPHLDDGIDVEIDVDPSLVLPLPLGRLSQVVLQLMQNALDALRAAEDGAGEKRISLAASVEEGGGAILLSLRDSGIGMEASVLDHALDPFFTTKEVGRGTGLGLSTAYQLIQGLGGTLEIQSRPGEGTEVMMRFPLTQRT